MYNKSARGQNIIFYCGKKQLITLNAKNKHMNAPKKKTIRLLIVSLLSKYIHMKMTQTIIFVIISRIYLLY